MADLNALIAQGVQFQRPPDPFAQYGQMQQLQQGQQQNQLNQMKMQQMQQASQRQNALYGTLAGFKPDMPVDAQVAELVRGGHLTEARSLAESHAKAQKDLRDADAAQLTNFATKTKLAGQILAGVTDDASYQRALPKLAAIDPKAAATMPPTFDPAFVAKEVQAGLDLKEQLERHFQEQNLGGSVRTVAMPKYGTGPAAVVQGSEAAVTPLPAGVEAQNLRRAAAGATRVSVDTGKKYGEAVAAGAGADDLKLFAQARQIPQDIEKIDQTLNILKKSDINTGLGAEVFTVLDRARAQFAADKKAGARVTSTEYLDSLLGSAVFPQIQALGIGARGMDTPAEREFLRKVMTGSITLNKDTLIKMTELRRNMLEDQAKQFNARVDSGELTRFFEAAGRKPMKVNVPAYSSGGAHPADIQAILDAQKAK